MKNFPFEYYALDEAAKISHPREINKLQTAIAEYTTANTSGVPADATVGSSATVYQISKPRKVRAAEPITVGAALNLYYEGNELVARLATNSNRERYCNAVSILAASTGNDVIVYENAGIVRNSGVSGNLNVFLGSKPGTFSAAGLGTACMQLLGFTDVNGIMYFRYNPPVAVDSTIYTNDNNAY